MYSRPSVSQIRAPQARATTRSVGATPRGTYRSRSASTRSPDPRSSTRIVASIARSIDGMQRKRARFLRIAQQGESTARSGPDVLERAEPELVVVHEPRVVDPTHVLVPPL